MKRVLAVALVLAAEPAAAHPLAFGRVELREDPAGRVQTAWRASGTAAELRALRVILPARCVAAGEPELAPFEDGIARVEHHRCGASLAGETLRVEGLAGTEVQLVARFVRADGVSADAVLDAARAGWAIPRGGGAGVAGRYVALGVEHIATGWDHLAFVLGLSLLVRGRRALLAAITAFTVGHSVTLAVAALGVVRAPVAALEAAIAWSVVVVARAALAGAETSSGRVPPWTLAALFGLLHGFGFAGALAETGLPSGAVARSLVAFNLGVELGQLAFVALALAVARLAARAGFDRARGRRAVATAIGVAGAYWCAQRALALGG